MIIDAMMIMIIMTDKASTRRPVLLVINDFDESGTDQSPRRRQFRIYDALQFAQLDEIWMSPMTCALGQARGASNRFGWE